MPLRVTPTDLPGVVIVEPAVFDDPRGYFFESFNAREFAEATGVDRPFVQDNQSRSARGVLRGLHFQVRRPQGKLVRVLRGEIFDVAVDLRRSSPTFGGWTGVRLSDANRRQLWVPEGFAHGFLVVSEHAELLYKTTDYWDRSDEHAIGWSDPELGIAWPAEAIDPATGPVLSPRDATAPGFATSPTYD